MSSTRTDPVRISFDGFGWRPLGRRRPVVADLDLTVEPGQRVLLAGPSGAGKSTLLLAVAGALGETIAGDLTGTVHADGRIGLLLQNPGDALVAERIGREIAFGPENLGLGRDETWRRVDEARASVGLTQSRDHPVSALSGGESQRLALAGTLALRPGALLLDEPTSMLDDRTAAEVRQAIDAVVTATGATMVVVEHRIEPWLDLVDRVVVLGGEGQVLADTTPGDAVQRFREGLGRAGVWMPGLPAPAPQPVDADLVAPDSSPDAVVGTGLGVTLVRRSLRDTRSSVALRDVDVRLDPGTLAALVGPSGAGKSTLLAVLAGLLEPTTGRVDGYGRPPTELASRALAARLGWVPQNPEHGLLATSVAEEVRLTAATLGRAVDVEGLLAHLGLEQLAGSHPYRLSGGEQRRLALACGLGHRPGVLLLDEPTVGQDRGTWAAVTGWMTSAARHGAVVAGSTHDDLLVGLADQVVGLQDGARV